MIPVVDNRNLTYAIMCNPSLLPGLGFFPLDGEIKIETKDIDMI